MKKTLFGLSENIVSAIAYAGLFVTGIIVFVMERENKNVRFHALQSTVWFAALCLIFAIGGCIPLIGGLISWLTRMLILVSWVFLMFAAYKGTLFKIPMLGDIVWEQISK